MKIFKPKTVQVFPENPKSPDFITNVTLNSATETLKDFNKMCFLPAGSWMTGIDYDPQLSDHDLTILLPNNGPYHKMEADVFDARKCMKENILKRLETHKIPEETIHQKIIPSINIFPTPQIQHCFDSYDQFIKFTNLKISLDDKVDPDKGLWQMKNLVVNHFENEGKLLYLKKDGSLRLMPIKQNKKNFYNYLKQNNIYMP